MTAEEILSCLDEHTHQLPVLQNAYFEYVDARMTVFRSSKHWAIVFEMVAFADRLMEFGNYIYGVGNSIKNGFVEVSSTLFSYCEDAPLWNFETGKWLGDKASFCIVLGDTPKSFAPSDAEYTAAGIHLESETKGVGSLGPAHLLRYLCHHLQHPFFASNSDLNKLVDADTHKMDIFLQTQDWRHPNLFGNDDANEFFSNIDSIRILANAIKTGDLLVWNQQDSTEFNTDWHKMEAQRKVNELYEADQQELKAQLGPILPSVSIVEVIYEEDERPTGQSN